MERDCSAASSHLHVASCYEDSEDDSSVEIMKRPLNTPSSGALISCWILVLLSQVCAVNVLGICWTLVVLSQVYAAIFIGICLTLLCGRGIPIWTLRMSYVVVPFVFGFEVWACYIWTIMDWRVSMGVPFLNHLLFNVVINLILFGILIKTITADWEHDNSGEAQEEEEEEQADFFLLMND
jgi:hypothetical protein